MSMSATPDTGGTVGRTGTVAAIHTSKGGVPKRPCLLARVTVDGLAGDWQLDRRYHGGPDRAVCLYSLDRIMALREEGHPIVPGATGENVTLSGIDWDQVTPGARLQIGDVLLEVTAYADPCKTIRGAFHGERFVRIGQKVHPGWSRIYTRVLQGGELRPGDAVTLTPAPVPAPPAGTAAAPTRA